MARQQKGTATAETPASLIPNRIVSVEALEDFSENYNVHPPEQISDLAVSLETLGQFKSVTVWDRGNGRYTIVGGHGVVEAARRNGITQMKADVLPPETPIEKVRAVMIADNLHAQHSAPDETRLAVLLEEQRNAGFDLRALGSSEDALSALKERLAQEVLRRAEQAEAGQGEDDYGASDRDDDGEGEDAQSSALAEQDQDGVLLERLRLALVEPAHRVAPGDVWQLGGRHLLVCCDPLREWAFYFPYLEQQQEAAGEDAERDEAKPHPVIFAPFAGPFLCLGRRAHRRRYVLVQPDPYIAGHICDLMAQAQGEDAVSCIQSGDDNTPLDD